ncbi:hypothetical protein ACXR0O_03955 [Verrucomicrobiota bacterium sgz303538]
MPTTSPAEEHLRAIRSLMEKATIYRAISAPSALIGGVLSLVASVALHSVFRTASELDPERFAGSFLCAWLGVLVLTAIANTWILMRDARRRGEPFISAGMRLALRALLPSCLTAGVFTVFLTMLGEVFSLTPLWMLFYGLGLLATSHFAPRSIALLGWAFLIASFGNMIWFYMAASGSLSDVPVLSNILMGATFGVFHLVYAVCTWPRQQPALEPAALL